MVVQSGRIDKSETVRALCRSNVVAREKWRHGDVVWVTWLGK
jgi:hypothetical protein